MISGNKYEHCLEQFDIDEREIVVKYLDKIEYDEDDYYEDDKYINSAIYPVITCIIKKILHNEMSFVKDNKNILLMMVDVKKIVKDFIKIQEILLKSVLKCFPNLDMYAEISLLFCNNYVYGLIDRLRKNRNRVLRKLKLEKLNEKVF